MNIPRAVGKDDILKKFEFYAEDPYWSIWKKSVMLVRFNRDDMDESAEYLSKWLDLNEMETEALTLRLHTEKEKTYNAKSATYCNFTILIKEADKNTASAPALNTSGAEAYLMGEIERLREENKAIRDAMQMRDDEDEDEDEETDEDAISGFERIINHPVVSNLIASWTANAASGQRATNLNGTNDDVNDCLRVLFSKGVTVTHLRKLAEMPESKIKMLLTML